MKLSPLLYASVTEIESVFGCYSDVAIKIIENKKKMIEDGLEYDWSNNYKLNVGREPTENQLSYLDSLLSLSKIFELTKREIKQMEMNDVSILLDWLNLEKEVYDAVRTELSYKKSGDAKLRMMPLKKLCRQYQTLAKLWNDILEDDVITPEEAIKLHDTLRRYRIYHSDFEECTEYIYNTVLVDNTVDRCETVKLFEYVSAALKLMKSRIDFKYNNEQVQNQPDVVS